MSDEVKKQAASELTPLGDQETKVKLDLLYEVGKKVGSVQQLPRLVDRVTQMTKRMLNASAASVLLLDEKEQGLRFEAVEGEAGKLLKKKIIDVQAGVAGWVARNGKPLIVNDVTKDNRFSGNIDDITGFVTKSICCAPLVIRRKTIGVIEVLNKLDGNDFTRQDLEALVSVASTAALAIENARLHQSIEDAYNSTIGASESAISTKLPRTYRQSKRVTEYSAPIIQENKPAGLTEVTKDSSEWKRTEEELIESRRRFRDLVNLLPQSVWEIDTEGYFTFVNREGFRSHGYSVDEVKEPLNTVDVFIPEDRERMAQNTRRLLHGEDLGIVEYTALRKDGSTFPVLVYSSPIIRDNKVVGLRGVTIDVTERKQAEEALKAHRNRLEELVQERTAELKAANEQLQEELAERGRVQEVLQKAKDTAELASEAKSEFLARVSHEIRTPIHGIMGTLDLLQDTELEFEQREYVNMALSSANSLLAVINDILDFSKVEARQLELEETDFDLRTTLERAIETIAVTAHKKGLELVCYLPPEVPTALAGDAGRLRQVLVNLVDNAVKFTNRGEIVVNVGVETDRKNEVELHFTVRDTGIGIQKDKHNLIFDPFRQAESSSTREYGGTGLGLAICQQLVRLMRGRIWVASRLEKGSTFHFTSQFKKRDLGKRAVASNPANVGLKGLPVLVVDDNSTNRLMLRELLNHWGLKVTEAKDGSTALQKIEKVKDTSQRFCLILLDKTMPVMDGFDVVKQIQKSPVLRNVVMMLPSDTVSADAARCQEMGVSNYMVKPIKESVLLDTIHRIIKVTPSVNKKAEQVVSTFTEVGQLRILLVEDNTTSQLVARKTLEKMGHAVEIAENGLKALRMLKESKFDLVLMDAEMPQMNGFEATRLIRKREVESGEHIPIIATTAYAMKEDRDRCLEAGMDGYLPKPVTAEALRSRIEDLLTPRKEVNTSPVDFDAALQVVDGDRELLREVVDLFLKEDCPRRLRELAEGIEQQDARAVRVGAHSIKGAALSFGGQAVGAVAQRLEQIGREGNLSGAKILLEELKVELDRFTAMFSSFQPDTSVSHVLDKQEIITTKDKV
jgi:two-component system sensor histidine kinase/response regulator